MNVNRYKDKIFAKKPKNWPLNKPFYYETTEDQKLVVISISVKQKKILLTTLDKYVQHIKGSENRSLLSRVYGLYRIKQKKGNPVDLIVL
jgi:hypothetical protein